MLNLNTSLRVATVVVAAIFVDTFAVHAQLLPSDVGTTVAGYQDDFDGATLNPNWVVRGQNVFSVGGGMLHVSTAGGDPNHLLYELAGYNNSVQEVLTRIRVTGFGSGDSARGGIATTVEPATSQGINLHFRDEPNPGQRHLEFLDDTRAWGTEYATTWQNNTWYWLRLRHEPNAAAQGGANDVFGKLWLADGSQAEPASWHMTWDYIPTRTARTGFAGIVAGSLSGAAEFDVDYLLIKASGLPNVVVAPNTFVQTPVSITNQPHSLTVVEGDPVTFSVGVLGSPAPTFQWYRNNSLISAATNAAYRIPVVQIGDHGAVFKAVAQNVVSNTTYTATSSNAMLTVVPDDGPPKLWVVQALGLTQVQLTLSERVTVASATNRANYLITNSSGLLSISNATLDASQSNVVLYVSAMTEGATYTLMVNNLRDASSAGNFIAPNTVTNFTAVSYTPAAIGNPQPAGGAVPVPGGLNITGGGTDLGGTSDQFQFNYQPRTGDFDVRVRIDSLSLADAWSEAGLVAREDVTPGSRFASTIATPSISGSYFQSRAIANAAATLAGSFPVNYPNTWLRLRRVGNQFTGYAGFDGQNWTTLGSASLTMPATVLLGFAASSHNTNQTTTAAFRDFSEVTAAGVMAGPWPVEPLGPSTRRTSLVISEIMYNPLDRSDGKNLEFVELFNSLSTAEDLSGWRLDGDADFTFPPNTVIPAGGFLVVAQSPSDVASVHGISGVLGPFSSTNSLPNTRGTIQLRNRNGAVFIEAQYDTEPPWPVAADGAGHSLVLARPSYGERQVEAWASSDAAGGSPGRLDPVSVDPLRNVLINEFLAHTDEPALDFIELYNHSTQAAEISGCYLTDDRNTNKFTIPPGTVLLPRGFISFDQNQLGFALSSGGETIYFRNPSKTRVLDAVRFGPQANGVSSGRYPDGSPGVSELSPITPGTTNGPRLIRDIVFNEIMYHPISDNSDDEYIELFNRGSNGVSLAGWRLDGGISFTFPALADIPAGGYLVIAANTAWLTPRYPSLNAGNLLGDFGGSLANGGERIALAMPVPFLTTNQSIVTTNYHYVVVDEVTYGTGGRWGRWADGGGSSLELLDPGSDNRLAANWADSREGAKAPWTTISVSGVLDNGNVAADQLQVLLLGPGECLIDDVEVLTLSGSNLIANSTFESGVTGWTAEGTEEQSGLETTEGFNSSRSYHVRASERGDNQVNRIRTPLTTAQSAGVTNTIRAKVRWLRGHPEILFRLRGNWLEAAGTMSLPTNSGTPGLANSAVVPLPPPVIFDVSHWPPVPAANEAVVVTARADHPNPSLQLKYRIDPSATFTTLPMRDDGTGGDAVAGDGLHTATIPGQPANTLVAFHVRTGDFYIPNNARTFPSDAPTRECLVRFGETLPTGSFPSYRIWMTQATFNTWDARNNLNNTLNDVTFVVGNHRVIYNAGAVYAGSPYIAPGFSTPSGNRCGYQIEFPPDDPFLGDTSLVLDWPGGHGNENTAIQEQMAYWMADQMNLPFSHRYFIRLAVNGVTDLQRGGVFEAVFQPGGDFLEQWSPGNSQGEFYKIDRGFEFNDAGSRVADPMPQMLVYNTRDLTTGGTKKKTEVYRWTWLKRSFDRAHDYTNIFVIADVLNAASPEPYTSQTEALVDVEQWMGIFAAEHIIINFDSWGHDIGKNMYMYKPENGRWQLYLFDLDWLMLVSPQYNATFTASAAPLFLSNDPTVARMYAHPPFRRAYFRAVQNAVNHAFVASKYEPVMDAKYNALVANGITLCDGQALAAPTAVKTWFSQRRSYLVSQLGTVAGNFAVTNNGGNDFTVDTNLVTLVGTAPIEVASIRVNGVAYPVAWTNVTTWSLRLPVGGGQNPLTIAAYDANGQPLTNLVDSITVTSTAVPESPVGRVVINEIMYHPRLPDAEFIEVYNTSVATTFDLSGWRLNGADFTFADGTLLPPGAYLVIAKKRDVFAATYGSTIPVVGEFAGQLDNGGETLSLIKPGVSLAEDLLVDLVIYDDDPPWSTTPDGTGPSLQLIDASQDNSRVANWSDGSGWRFFSATGLAGTSASSVLLYLAAAGDVYLDDVRLVEGTQAGVGSNLLANGDFESGNLSPWLAGGNHATSVVSTNAARTGTRSLRILATGAGTTGSTISQPIATLSSTNRYTLSFWYLPSTNGSGLNYRISTAFRSLTPVNYRPALSTPGAVNSIAMSLPVLPPIWINELLPDNITGLADNAGDRDPWVELYNAGTNTVALSGWHLADNYTNLTTWAFPPDAFIHPGQFLLVWLDGEPGETTASALHAGFRIPPVTGSLALVFPLNSQPAVLDFANYSTSPDRSVGLYPDGQPGQRSTFFYATPGGTNNNAAPALPVFINEWMAANAAFMADPADGQFDDWFELFNPNDVAVDLTGYSLTDNLNAISRWDIPSGASIPARGFLLVWADNETTQNSTNSAELHAGFRLSQGGEAIGLFAPNGSLVDSVTFGPQTNDVSHGRWPDGGGNLYFMPTPTPRAPNTIPDAPAAIRLVEIRVVNGVNVSLSWTSEPGRTYRVQFKNSLEVTSWSNLTDIVATGVSASFTEPMAGTAQRFYRIERLGL